MSVDPGRPGRLERARPVVQLVGEIHAVAVVARSLLGDRPPATMERPLRHQET